MKGELWAENRLQNYKIDECVDEAEVKRKRMMDIIYISIKPARTNTIYTANLNYWMWAITTSITWNIVEMKTELDPLIGNANVLYQLFLPSCCLTRKKYIFIITHIPLFAQIMF